MKASKRVKISTWLNRNDGKGNLEMNLEDKSQKLTKQQPTNTLEKNIN